MDKINSSLEKRIHNYLSSYFLPLGFSNPNHWYVFEQTDVSDKINCEYYFDFECHKNRYEIEFNQGANIYSLNSYGLTFKINAVEQLIQEYIKKLDENGCNTINIQRSTILLNREKIYELDTNHIFRLEKKYFLETEFFLFLDKLLLQIKDVLIPYSSQFEDINYTNQVVNSTINNFKPLTWADYGAYYFKKMIIAQLAKSNDFELISEAMKKKFEENIKDEDVEIARNWEIAYSLFDEMYEKIRKM